jgi:HD-GYP domain-containing protein (c-di-GMP phosphodiesterase class II)
MELEKTMDQQLLQDQSNESTAGLFKPFQVKRDWGADMKSSLLDNLADVNKELWLVLSLVGIAAIMNYLLTAQRVVLGLYTLPTLFSAYFYGRRHAVLTAFASIFLVGLLAYYNTNVLVKSDMSYFLVDRHWYDLIVWAGILVITAYTMGTLHERLEARVNELRESYHGLLVILRQFISKDKYTENHCYRVSIYATKISTDRRYP